MATAIDPFVLDIPDKILEKFNQYGRPWSVLNHLIKEKIGSEEEMDELAEKSGIPVKTIQNYSTGGTYGWGASDIPLFRLLILDYRLGGELFTKYFPRLFDYLPAEPLPESGELNQSVLDEAIPAVKGLVEIMETAQTKGLDTMSTKELHELFYRIDPGILELVINMKAEVAAVMSKRDKQLKE